MSILLFPGYASMFEPVGAVLSSRSSSALLAQTTSLWVGAHGRETRRKYEYRSLTAMLPEKGGTLAQRSRVRLSPNYRYDIHHVLDINHATGIPVANLPGGTFREEQFRATA
jgi:hypothetical protein